MDALNTPILLHLGKKNAIPGDYGIEIEWEGSLKTWLPDSSLYWDCKEDGSLRNGFEFVLRRPKSISELPEVMAEFANLSKGSKPKYSARTSVHVHINVTRYTLQQIYTLIVFNLLVERMLIQTQGLDRKGNLFCLGVHDAEAVFDQLLFSISTGEFFNSFNIDHYKYSSLNLCAVHNYGSLEWRFLRGITDLKEIEDWVRNLATSSKMVAEKYTPDTLINFYRYSDSLTFLKAFYEESFLQKYVFPQAPLWRQHLKDNFQYAYELVQALKKGERKQFLVPYIKLTNEDLPPDESVRPFKPHLKRKSTSQLLNELGIGVAATPVPAPQPHVNPMILTIDDAVSENPNFWENEPEF